MKVKSAFKEIVEDTKLGAGKFTRSFSEVCIKRNYRLFDGGAAMSLLLR